LSENTENYLKNIYMIQQSDRRVTTTSLSRRLQISPASVSEMMRKLADTGYLTYRPYRGVRLTGKGRAKALKIIRRHRLWELFLVRILKYDWDEIHEEAEKLEHVVSPQLEQRIDEILGYPRNDPHGDEIPTPEGTVEGRELSSLATIDPPAELVVVRVSDASPDILKYASRLGIKPGKRMTLTEKLEFDGSMRANVEGVERFVSRKLAEHIFVERE
jgi:DtxR family Mn-dependent transcriptional regulator